MPDITRYPIFAALDADWRRFARSDPARQAVRRWRLADPALADVHTVSDFLALRRAPERADQMLRALVRLAPTDPVAARAVLQGLIPGLIKICDRWRIDDTHTLAGEAVAIAWEKICTYIDRGHASVAARLLGMVQDQLHLEARPLEPVEPSGDVRAAEEVALSNVVFEELRTEARRAIGDARCLDLIIDSRVNGRPIKEIAWDSGEAPHTLMVRRTRAEHRIRERIGHRLEAA